MFRIRIISFVLLLALCIGCNSVLAAEVDCDATYCVTTQDFFTQADEPMVGICVTALPDGSAGTVFLGHRMVQPGDILTTEQIAALTFSPVLTKTDKEAVLTYLPIYENRVEKAATMTFSIRGKTDKAPVAQDSALETYKNLPNESVLKVSDPEGEALTYTLVRKPKRGDVVLREDGSFLYTPKKNKVGVDSFTYTATDPAGNVSRTATVTIQILKPADARQYADTAGMSCRFAAEWMRNTGLFVGEQVGGQSCFYPEKAVSRGEFLAMLVKVLDIPTKNVSTDALPQDTPTWLKPYLAAALRAGLTAGLPEADSFGADSAITGAEAAVMLQNALDLTISQETLETQSLQEETQDVPAWASVSLLILADNGICLSADETINRGQAAEILYCVSDLALDAPGRVAWN